MLEVFAFDVLSDVPAFFVVFFMLASVIANVFSWLTLFPLSYLYGSVEARKQEKASFEEEERRLQGLQ